jgi:hypothetical protein
MFFGGFNQLRTDNICFYLNKGSTIYTYVYISIYNYKAAFCVSVCVCLKMLMNKTSAPKF